MFLERRPLVQPCLKLIEIRAPRLFKIGKVDGIVHMRQGIKIAKANLHRIPAISSGSLLQRLERLAHDLDKVGFEAGAADERAVDIGALHELSNIG